MIRNTLSTFTTIERTAGEVEALIADRENAFFVAERDGNFEGFVTFEAFRPGPGYAATVEHTVLLTENAQSKGVGRVLLQRAEQAAQSLGHHVMVAAISQTNTGAQAFHERMGFTEVARMPQVGRKAGRWLDLVLMQKIL